MKVKVILAWVVLLVFMDQVIKIVINTYYLESHFEIIPSLVEFMPVFNDKHSYVNNLLNKYLNIDVGLWAHLAVFLFMETAVLFFYFLLRSKSVQTKLLDIALVFQVASLLCALSGNLIWENGTLDYIYLKPLFVFDLKDV